MATGVTLRVDVGMDPGKEYVFTTRTVGSLGRAADCLVQLPNDLGHLDVSRHHCLFEINPPEIHVRDLGSRNGTFVNGQLIGKRDPRQPPETAPALEMPECVLHDGDAVKVGRTVLRVHIAEKDGSEVVDELEVAI